MSLVTRENAGRKVTSGLPVAKSEDILKFSADILVWACWPLLLSANTPLLLVFLIHVDYSLLILLASPFEVLLPQGPLQTSL